MRKLLRDQLDRNNPSSSIVKHLITALQPFPVLNNIYIKLTGYGGQKGDLHRKFMAALTGSVQVGSGANNEDIIFNEKDYSVLISTRFNSRWGDVILGDWSLKEDDAKRYLSDSEQKRLQSGSPEERDVLRRRIVIELTKDESDFLESLSAEGQHSGGSCSTCGGSGSWLNSDGKVILCHCLSL